MKFGNLNFLELSGLLQACNGTDLPYLELFSQGYGADSPRVLTSYPYTENLYLVSNRLIAECISYWVTSEPSSEFHFNRFILFPLSSYRE